MPVPPKHAFVTIALHHAGATVLHRSPFDNLDVPYSEAPLDKDFCTRWVVPFYMAIPGRIPSTEAALRPLFWEITPDLCTTLLANFNWRPRITSGFFIALRRFESLQDDVGRLLLRSDVCFAAMGYCLALARLNTPRASEYLREYRAYYLRRRELEFDQGFVLSALRYLDRVNGTDYREELLPVWSEFFGGRPSPDLDAPANGFAGLVDQIAALADRMGPHP
jgi:hypothetical protein